MSFEELHIFWQSSTIEEKIEYWKNIYNKKCQEFGIKPFLTWDLVNNQSKLIAIIKVGPYSAHHKCKMSSPIIWEVEIERTLLDLGRQALRDVK